MAARVVAAAGRVDAVAGGEHDLARLGAGQGRVGRQDEGSDAGMKGTNIFVVKDGDRLKILSAAKTDEIATENARKALDALKAAIIGG